MQLDERSKKVGPSVVGAGTAPRGSFAREEKAASRNLWSEALASAVLQIK
jgi:hypothetical protein